MAMDPQMIGKLLMMQHMQQQPGMQMQGGMAPQMGMGQSGLQGLSPILQALMARKMMGPQQPPGLLSPDQPNIRQAMNANIPGQNRMPPLIGPQQ